MNVIETMKDFGRGIIFNSKKYAPEILLGVGIVAGVGTVVAAVVATTKADVVLDSFEDQKTALSEAKEDGTLVCLENDVEVYYDYDGSTYNQDMARLYLRTGLDLAKLYAPAAGLGALSVTSILYSYGILNKRNVAITAAYNAVDGAFRKYRACVVEEFGPEKDRDLRRGIVTKTYAIEEEGKNGKKKTINKELSEVFVTKDPTGYSDYARFFDETNPCWKKNPEYNLMYLKAQQDNATRLLNARGYLFLNEVYDMIGVPRTQAGQMIGWIKSDPNNHGFVDFGIYDENNERARDFVNGYEPAILLDFNVDGVIWDRI